MLCFLGLHQPSISAITRRRERLTTICERCCRPLEKSEDGRWVAAMPLDERVAG